MRDVHVSAITDAVKKLCMVAHYAALTRDNRFPDCQETGDGMKQYSREQS